MQLLIFKKAFLKNAKKGPGKNIFGHGNVANVSITKRHSNDNSDRLLDV